MAVSFRVVIFLIAIMLFAFVYGVGMEVVDIIQPLANNGTGTSHGNDIVTWTASLWSLLPVFALLAMGAWLLKQAVVIKQ